MPHCAQFKFALRMWANDVKPGQTLSLGWLEKLHLTLQFIVHIYKDLNLNLTPYHFLDTLEHLSLYVAFKGDISRSKGEGKDALVCHVGARLKTLVMSGRTTSLLFNKLGFHKTLAFSGIYTVQLVHTVNL